MERNGHIMMGLGFGVILIALTHFTLGWYIFDWRNIIIYLAIMITYALLPDIDIKSGTIVWVFIPLSIIGLFASQFLHSTSIFDLSLGLLTITYVSAEFLGHRGLTHSLLFGLIVSIPLVFFIPYQMVILAFLCYYSHLVADKIYFKLI